MLQPDRYLAAALAEIPDENLVGELGIDLPTVRRLRVSRPPRPDHWHQDMLQLAMALNVNLPALETLLQRVGVRP
jgi:hypothetical protein